jgi:hypothetical protein
MITTNKVLKVLISKAYEMGSHLAFGWPLKRVMVI